MEISNKIRTVVIINTLLVLFHQLISLLVTFFFLLEYLESMINVNYDNNISSGGNGPHCVGLLWTRFFDWSPVLC